MEVTDDSFVNDPNELNPAIGLWPDGPPSSLPGVSNSD
jgi:hypothetical protein